MTRWSENNEMKRVIGATGGDCAAEISKNCAGADVVSQQ
jgi:hypothetical protein